MSEVWKLRTSSLALSAALAIVGGCISGAGDPGSDDGAPHDTAGALQASVVTSTMYLSSRVYPGRDLVPGTAVDTVASTPGDPVHLVATVYPGYRLLFWHVPRTLTVSSVVDFTVPDAESFYATAWYVATGSCQSCPPPPPTVSTVAFSNDRDEVIADTPIASVSVAGAWAGPPSTVVSTAGSTPVAITAQSLLDGSGEFVSWLSLDGFAASGRTLTEPALASDVALALFAIPSPDPCADLRATRDNLDPGDFQTPDAYRRALARANALLHACERAHGEPLD
jgi:hypothetical protein